MGIAMESRDSIDMGITRNTMDTIYIQNTVSIRDGKADPNDFPSKEVDGNSEIAFMGHLVQGCLFMINLLQ